MKGSLFCYGTLQNSEIIETLTKQTLNGVPAQLSGYGCYRVANADYPGIRSEIDSTVNGTLYHQLTPTAFKVLDRFEGEMYKRILIQVDTDKDQAITAWAYVIKTGWLHRLTDQAWHYEDHVSAFLKRFRRSNLV